MSQADTIATADRALDLVVAAMGANAVLKPLSAEARRRLAAGGSPLSLEPGQLLCQAGDAGDAVYVLLEGEIEIGMRSLGGRDVRLLSQEAGAILGEMAALDGGPRSADMAAVRRCRLWRIPRGLLIETLEAEPKAAVALVAELSRRIRASNNALEAARLLDLGGRLASLLLSEKGARDCVALTQTEIARRLGASREKVNRKLHGWVAEGWVRLAPAGVMVEAPDRLAQVIDTARRR